MGFTIDYGPPGIVMIVLIVLGVAGLVIFARFLLSVVNSAHEDVVEAEEDDHPA